MFDFACSNEMSVVQGKLYESKHVENVNKHGFNRSTSGPTKLSWNGDGKREIYVPDMDGSNLVLPSANKCFR